MAENQIQRNGGSIEKAFKEYEQDWYIQCFETVRGWLCENCPDVKILLDGVNDQNRFLARTAAVVDQVALANCCIPNCMGIFVSH